MPLLLVASTPCALRRAKKRSPPRAVEHGIAEGREVYPRRRAGAALPLRLQGQRADPSDQMPPSLSP